MYGTVTRRPPVERYGQMVDVIEFRYDDDFIYVRYFDPASGRLLGTDLSDTVEIREMGFISIGGVRFPQEVETYVKGELVNRIVFDRVEVNVEIDPELFEYPAITPRSGTIPRTSP